MEGRKTHRGLAGGCIASLLAAVASALAMGLCPAGAPAAAETALGVAAVLSGTGFSLCGSAWLNRTFEEATGGALSAYYQTLFASAQKGEKT